MSVWRFISALAFLLGGSFALAASPLDRSAVAPSDTIVITSQSLVFKNQENTAVFEGKVVMTKVDFTMHADQMVVHFEGTSGAASKGGSKGSSSAQTRPSGPETPTLGNRAISLIEAVGNVVMQQGGKKAKSKKAVLSQHDEKLVLTGDPEVWEKGYHISGVKMTMFLKEDRSIVEGSRVVISESEADSR
jgi:lipopolysaccharide export system protein LptA